METKNNIKTQFQNEMAQLDETSALPDTSEELVEYEEEVPPRLPILVVEEDEMSRLLVSYILYNHNISFELSATAEEAKEKLSKNSYSLILAGVNGTDPDLHDAFKKKIPVLAVTASVSKNKIEHYLEAGYEYVLAEPYEEQVLIHLILKHMKKMHNTGEENIHETERAHSFSLEPLQKICKNDNNFVLKMLDKFNISVSECSEGLHSGDPAKMKTAAHKSIPSYSIMGLEDIVKDLAFIEHHADVEEDRAKVAELARSIEQRNEIIMQDVADYMTQIKEKLS